MINKRFTTTLKTLLENEYIVYIKLAYPDSPPNGYSFNTTPECFTLSYKGSGSDFTTPIRGSEVVLTAIVENSDFAEFIDDIASEQDQTYVIEILKKESGGSLFKTFWTGYIWPEEIKQSYGDYPYTIALKASDSAARIKDYLGLQYSGELGANPDSNMWNMFRQVFAAWTPGASFDQGGGILTPPATSGAGYKIRFAQGISWSNNFPPLGMSSNLWKDLQVRSSHDLYHPTSTLTRFDIIIDWLRLWGCRMWMDSGYYYIVDYQRQAMGSQWGVTQMEFTEHDVTGEPTGVNSVIDIGLIAGNKNKILEGASISYKQAYRSVKVSYSETFGVLNQEYDLNFPPPAGQNKRNVKEYSLNMKDIWFNSQFIKNPEFPSGQYPNLIDITDYLRDDASFGGVTEGSLVEIMAKRSQLNFSKVQKYFNGTIRSKDMTYTHVLHIAKERFIPNSVTLTAATDEWQGEWVKVGELADNPWLSQNTDTQMESQSLADKINFQS